jgi:TP901 family phage tail tape measure protein
MANREVSISIRVDDSGSDGAFRRLTARFNELGDTSDTAIKKIGDSLDRQLMVAFSKGGDREYLETVRRLAPQLRALQEQIKAGAFNLEDYGRRMQMLHSFTKDAIAQTEHLGEAFRDTRDEAKNTGTTLKDMLGEFGGNLAARAVSQVLDYVKQLGQEAARTSLEVQQSVANISTLKDIDLSQTTNQLFDLSTRVPQSAQQLGEGLYNIFSSVEATQSQAVALLEQFAKGAVAARTDTQTFGTAVLGVINAYKLELSDAAHVSDVFFNTVNLGVVNGQELAANLGLVTQSAKNAGVTFDQLGALIAGVTKEGGPAAQNINNLSNLLMKLPTTEASDGLKKLGIQLADSKGEFRPILDVLTDLKARLNSLTPAARALELQKIFPDLQARTGLTTILSQLDFVKNATLENARAAGVSEEAYKKMSGTASAQLQLFHNSLIAFLAKLSEWITQSRILGTVLGWLGSLFGVMGRNTGTVLILVAALGGLVLALNAVSVAASINAIVAYVQGLGGLISVIGNVGKAMIGLQTTFATTGAVATAATGGWLAVLGLLAGVVLALYNYSQSSKEVKSADEGRVKTLQSVISTTQEDIKFLQDQSKSLKDSSEARSRYDSIMKSVTVTDRLTIQNIEDETAKRAALAGVLQHQLDLRQEELRSQAVTAAVASTSKLQEALDAEKQLQTLMQGRKFLMAEIDKGVMTRTTVHAGQEEIENYAEGLKLTEKRIGELSETSKQARDVLDQNVAVLAQMATQANQTGIEFLKQNGILITNKDAQIQLAQKIDEANETILRQKQAALEAGKAVLDYAGNIQTLKFAQADASISNNGVKGFADNLQNELNAAKEKGADYTDTLRQLKPLLDQLANALRSGSKDAKDYAERLKLVPDSVRDALKESQKFGQYNPFENTKKQRAADLSDAKKYVRGMKAELGDLQTVLDAMRRGTMGQESGGRTAIQNPRTNATGLFQVLPVNVPNWTKKYVGKIFSVAQFKKDVDAQVTVFNGEMGKYLQIAMKRSGGDVKKAIRMAAAAWYGGEGAMDNYDKNFGGKGKEPTFREYTTRVLQQTLAAAGGRQSSEIREFDAEAQTLREIAETRARINQLINEGGDANKKQLDGLHDYENNLKEIEKLVDQINASGLKDHLVMGLPDTAADARKMVERLQAFTQLQSSLRSQTDSAKERMFELSGEMNGGLTDVEKFDHHLQVLRESGKLTAADFALLADDIKKTREQLIELSKTEHTKNIGEAFKQMADNFRQELVEKSPINDFLHSLEQVKDLKLDGGALTQVKGLFAVGNQVDTENFATYIRQWLTLLSSLGGFDATKIDEVVGKLRAAANGFNAATRHKNDLDFDSLKKDLSGQLEEFQRGGRDLTEYEKTLRQINTDYKDLDPAQKQYLLNMAAEVDAQRQFQKTYEEVHSVVRDSLQTFVDEGWGGLFKSIRNKFKTMLLDMAADLITSNLMKLLTGQSNTSKNATGGGLLNILFGNRSATGNSSPVGSNQGGGFSLGNNTNSLFGGGRSTPQTTGGFAGGNPVADLLRGGGSAQSVSGGGGGRPAWNGT